MIDTKDLRLILEDSDNKRCVIYTLNGFRYEAMIQRTFGDFLQFHDTKKNFDKIIRISEIREIDFR